MRRFQVGATTRTRPADALISTERIQPHSVLADALISSQRIQPRPIPIDALTSTQRNQPQPVRWGAPR
jgi:hypothetical protein